MLFIHFGGCRQSSLYLSCPVVVTENHMDLYNNIYRFYQSERYNRPSELYIYRIWFLNLFNIVKLAISSSWSTIVEE